MGVAPLRLCLHWLRATSNMCCVRGAAISGYILAANLWQNIANASNDISFNGFVQTANRRSRAAVVKLVVTKLASCTNARKWAAGNLSLIWPHNAQSKASRSGSHTVGSRCSSRSTYCDSDFCNSFGTS